MDIVYYILCGLLAYLVGSINPSLILSNSLMSKDIRKYGSGNAGTTNMLRVFGWQFALVTFLCDVLKGCVSVALSRHFCGDIAGFIASIAVVVGHNWPAYYGFRGGKGVATTFGVLIIWQPALTFAVFAVAIGIVALTRMVSLAAMSGAVLSFVAVMIFYPGEAYLMQRIAIGILAVFVVFQHRANIKRIIAGKENKISFKSSAVIMKEMPKGDTNQK